MKSVCKGTITALITPFKDGKLDEAGFIENIRFQIQSGIDGILPLGTTGEGPTLSSEEQRKVMDITLAEGKGKVPVIIHTSHYSTSETIQRTKLAKDADAVLIITPYYNKPTQEGIYLHFKAIADAVDIPIIIYNHPGRCGKNIEISTMKRLAAIPNIIGVKDSSGNVTQIADIIHTTRDMDFNVVSGDDGVTLPAISIGAKGVISVVGNLIPKEMKSLVDTALLGDFKLAAKKHFSLIDLFAISNIETNPIPIKAAMRLCQRPAGHCRLPLCDLEAVNAEKLQKVLKQMELL